MGIFYKCDVLVFISLFRFSVVVLCGTSDEKQEKRLTLNENHIPHVCSYIQNKGTY